METLLVIQGLLQLATLLTSNIAKAKAEGRDPTPEEQKAVDEISAFLTAQRKALDKLGGP